MTKKLILFQGDSITDAWRNKEDSSDLGRGYALMIAGQLQASNPSKRIAFLNRGINGHRVQDLKNRWQRDCIDLKPDVVSILIGINDVWRRYDGHKEVITPEEFEADYRFLLDEIKDKLYAKVILMSPFVLSDPQERLQWREDLDPKIKVVEKLAKEYDVPFIPLDALFQEVSQLQEPSYWAPDGVHPSPAGHGLIAQAWLKAFNKLNLI